jgi:hypothetical protein
MAERLFKVLKISILLSCGIAAGCGTTPESPPAAPVAGPEAAGIERSSAIVHDIASLAEQNQSPTPSPAIEEKIDQLLDPCTTAELGQVALLCAALAESDDSSTQMSDNVLDLAKERCVNRLSQTKGTAAKDALEELRRTFDTDGGAALIIDDAIQYQAALK